MAPNQKDEALLKEIRDRFDYCFRRWQKTREEGAKDIQYRIGDPWPASEKAARSSKETERPMLVLDEISQFLNGLINSQRQTKTAIKVDPRGNGATDKSAAYRADQIRQIEYKSKAQLAYLQAFTGAVERSYGFTRIIKKHVEGSFDQELYIEAIPNPDSVFIDPDFIQPDASDIKYGFIIDKMQKAEFINKYPQAKITSFSPALMETAPKWLGDDSVQVAEYAKIETTKRTLIELDMGQGPITIYLDEIPGAKLDGNELVGKDGSTLPITNQRVEECHKVVKYITNGIEILEPIPWDGKYIPIGCCFGPEVWVPTPGGSERIFESLIRHCRDAVMGMNFTATSQLELAGQVPKSPWVGYTGQFEGQEEKWSKASKVPVAYLQAHAFTDEYPMATGSPLPLPERNMFEPALQQLEMLKESFRRSIQAAMGLTSLPTAAQRQNQKSGVALEKIEAQQANGSYHFVDKFNAYKMHMGRMLDDLLGPTYDTERDLGMRGEDGRHYQVRANTQEPYQDPQSGENHHYRPGSGDHDVSISVGATYDSERDKAEKVAEQIASPDMMAAAVSGNQKAAKIVALAIRLQNGGPLMDSIAEVLDPEDDQPPVEQLKSALGQAQQKLQLIGAAMQELQQKADQVQATLEGKRIDSETRKWCEAVKALAGLREAQVKAGIDSAELDAQMLEHLTGLMADADKLTQQHAHEAGIQAMGHVATASEAEASRAHESVQSDADRQAAAEAAKAKPAKGAA